MCQSANQVILNQSAEHQLTYCHACQTFTMLYKSCCTSFAVHELRQFCTQLERIEPEHFSLEGMGQQLAVNRARNCGLGMCLSQQDVAYLSEQLKHALLLHEAYQIINT